MTRDLRRAICAIVIASISLWVASGANADSSPQWQRALHARSAALDQQYRLGRFAIPASATTTTTPDWLLALEMRSRALNARYRSGTFAVQTPPNGFHWQEASIGAGVTAALGLLIAAVALAAARRTRTRAARPA
jgi:hypothetical protein